MLRARRWAAVLAALTVTACGGGSGGGSTGPIVNPPAVPVLVSLLFDCGADTTMLPGADRFCSVEELWSDGRKVIVTQSDSTTWSATGPVAVVPGRVTAMGPGEATVTVSRGGKTASVKLVVKKKDTYRRDELPAMSDEVLGLVDSLNIRSYGLLAKTIDGEITIWGQPGVDPEDLRIVAEFANQNVPGRKFRVASDSVSAHTWVVWDSNVTYPTPASAGPRGHETDGIIRHGVIRLATHNRGLRTMDQDGRTKNLIHELLHVLGLAGHPEGCHIMSYVCWVRTMDPLMTEYYTWLHRSDVQPGIKKIN